MESRNKNGGERRGFAKRVAHEIRDAALSSLRVTLSPVFAAIAGAKIFNLVRTDEIIDLTAMGTDLYYMHKSGNDNEPAKTIWVKFVDLIQKGSNSWEKDRYSSETTANRIGSTIVGVIVVTGFLLGIVTATPLPKKSQ